MTMQRRRFRRSGRLGTGRRPKYEWENNSIVPFTALLGTSTFVDLLSAVGSRDRLANATIMRVIGSWEVLTDVVDTSTSFFIGFTMMSTDEIAAASGPDSPDHPAWYYWREVDHHFPKEIPMMHENFDIRSARRIAGATQTLGATFENLGLVDITFSFNYRTLLKMSPG